ncbi:hypothetical protein G6F50_018269 [Rhizopus delemar]|uniref:Uncharacterized protein n=1 Tax=Rhizopus delemar TaxID=936053 RepID=A0A9P6XMX7_9FUNG|nr:hypothetical protein G6F50_018269 [Rhizopus delemar]
MSSTGYARSFRPTTRAIGERGALSSSSSSSGCWALAIAFSMPLMAGPSWSTVNTPRSGILSPMDFPAACKMPAAWSDSIRTSATTLE